MPASPLPSRNKVPGSGTDVGAIIMSAANTPGSTNPYTPGGPKDPSVEARECKNVISGTVVIEAFAITESALSAKKAPVR